MTTTYVEFEKFNPFRRPDWRLERVLQMVDRQPNPGRSTRRDDEYVRALRQFILRYRGRDDAGRRQLFRENPGLFFAWLIHERREQHRELPIMIEGRILAGQSDNEISDELHTLPDAVNWYEKLFFNVRDRLKAHDWIVKHVLMPAVSRSLTTTRNRDGLPEQKPLSEPFFDSTLKFFGYFGGPLLLEFMISGFRRGMVAYTQEDIVTFMDEHWMTQMRRRSNMASGMFEVNKYNVMELFATHARIIEIARSVESEDATRTQIDKNIQALLKDLPWTVGRDGARSFEGTPIQIYDDSPVELRDEELLLLSTGKKPVTIAGAETLKMPLPRRPGGQEDQADANAQ